MRKNLIHRVTKYVLHSIFCEIKYITKKHTARIESQITTDYSYCELQVVMIKVNFNLAILNSSNLGKFLNSNYDLEENRQQVITVCRASKHRSECFGLASCKSLNRLTRGESPSKYKSNQNAKESIMNRKNITNKNPEDSVKSTIPTHEHTNTTHEIVSEYASIKTYIISKPGTYVDSIRTARNGKDIATTISIKPRTKMKNIVLRSLVKFYQNSTTISKVSIHTIPRHQMIYAKNIKIMVKFINLNSGSSPDVRQKYYIKFEVDKMFFRNAYFDGKINLREQASPDVYMMYRKPDGKNEMLNVNLTIKSVNFINIYNGYDSMWAIAELVMKLRHNNLPSTIILLSIVSRPSYIRCRELHFSSDYYSNYTMANQEKSGRVWTRQYWGNTDSESDFSDNNPGKDDRGEPNMDGIQHGTSKSRNTADKNTDKNSTDIEELSDQFSSDEEEKAMTLRPISMYNIPDGINVPYHNSKPSAKDPRVNRWPADKLLEVREVEQQIRLALTAPITIPTERAEIMKLAGDPREAATVPIPNPTWERMSKQEAQSIKNRQLQASKGDILTPILQKMTYANHISYAFKADGAQFTPVAGTSTSPASPARKKPKGSRNVPITNNKKPVCVTARVCRLKKKPVSKAIVSSSSDDEGDTKLKARIKRTNAVKSQSSNLANLNKKKMKTVPKPKNIRKKKTQAKPMKRPSDTDTSDIVSDDSWPTDDNHESVVNPSISRQDSEFTGKQTAEDKLREELILSQRAKHTKKKKKGSNKNSTKPGSNNDSGNCDMLAQVLLEAGLDLSADTMILEDDTVPHEFNPGNMTYEPSMQDQAVSNSEVLTPPTSDNDSGWLSSNQPTNLGTEVTSSQPSDQAAVDSGSNTDFADWDEEIQNHEFETNSINPDDTTDEEPTTTIKVRSYSENNSLYHRPAPSQLSTYTENTENTALILSQNPDNIDSPATLLPLEDDNTTNQAELGIVDSILAINVSETNETRPVIAQTQAKQQSSYSYTPFLKLQPISNTVTPELEPSHLTGDNQRQASATTTSTSQPLAPPTWDTFDTERESANSNTEVNEASNKNYLTFTSTKYRETEHALITLLSFLFKILSTTMSAKNISKDRSASRDRKKDQDRFGKQRDTGEEDMDAEETPRAGTSSSGAHPGYKSKDGNDKRKRDPPRTGNHDNTTAEDSEEELPQSKRQTTSIREKLTHAYEKKTQATKAMREADGTAFKPSVQFDIDLTGAGTKIQNAEPLLEPAKLADAPVVKLQDLIPDSDRGDPDIENCDESIHAERLEFVVVERAKEKDEDSATRPDRDYDWEIPERDLFEDIIGETINIFTSDSPEDLQFLEFSSVGWNTGIGLFAFRADKLTAMEEFRTILRGIEIAGKKFESYPKRMLLNRYALTIYFNAAFSRIVDSCRLLFWIKQFNGFKGQMEMVETRRYPVTHPSRKGCRIVAFEADQVFLDELYKFPRDHPFTIRFGGNLYIRGGDRIDPDDPDAVKSRRPRLSRHAARKLLAGSGEEVLSAGQTEEDAAAARAREAHKQKQVSILLYLCVTNLASDSLVTIVFASTFYTYLKPSIAKQNLSKKQNTGHRQLRPVNNQKRKENARTKTNNNKIRKLSIKIAYATMIHINVNQHFFPRSLISFILFLFLPLSNYLLESYYSLIKMINFIIKIRSNIKLRANIKITSQLKRNEKLLYVMYSSECNYVEIFTYKINNKRSIFNKKSSGHCYRHYLTRVVKIVHPSQVTLKIKVFRYKKNRESNNHALWRK